MYKMQTNFGCRDPIFYIIYNIYNILHHKIFARFHKDML